MINMPSASARVFVYALGLIVAFCAGAWVGYQPGAVRAERAERALAMAQRDAAQQVALAQEQARAAEQRMTEQLAAVDARYRQEIEDAKATGERVAADLRASTLRLRREWAGCETARLSDAAAASPERDALAGLRAEAAGRIVRIGREADDQLRACQAVIRAYRGESGQ